MSSRFPSPNSSQGLTRGSRSCGGKRRKSPGLQLLRGEDKLIACVLLRGGGRRVPLNITADSFLWSVLSHLAKVRLSASTCRLPIVKLLLHVLFSALSRFTAFRYAFSLAPLAYGKCL